MYTLRPHQKEGAQYISKYGMGSSKGNFVSVACCVSSGKTLLAIAGFAENIKNNLKTCQVFICPRLNLCKQQAEDIYDYLEENGLNCAVVLYNSAKYDGDKNISVCSDRKVTNTEFFTNCDHVIIVACNESIWGGKDTECFIRKNTFENILKNNEKYGRKNAAIIYDEAHNYESKFDTIKELSGYFNVSVLMSGTPGKEQRNIHKVSDHVDYSIRSAILENIICKPTLNVINGYDSDTYLMSAVNSILFNEKPLHKGPFKTRLLVCAKSIDSIRSVADKLTDCHVITLHSNKEGQDDDNNVFTIVPTIDGVEKSAEETMKIIEALDKNQNYFNDDLPIVIFQVDMISEGINIKSFNSVLITSYSEVKQMQQIGRVLRDTEFNGHHKKAEDEVSIYAAVENKEDLAQLLINLEEYDLTDDVFKWGKITNANNGSSPETGDNLAVITEWQQIDEALDIEEIMKLTDKIANGKINSKLSSLKISSEKYEEFYKELCKAMKKAAAKVSAKSSKSSAKKINSASASAQNKDTGSDGDKKTKEQTNLAALLRALYHGILQVTKDKTNRRLWQKDKRDGIYQALNFNDFELVDTFVKEIGWRF